MHRISDFRVGGIARRNFNMFRKLCGDENLKNVVIVTNMWGQVDPSIGEARENELRTHPQLFQPAMASGANMLRHHNTLESAHAIVRHIFKNHPLPLRIQRELVDEHKDISQTAAGKELDRELLELIEKHKAEMAELQQDMAAALAEKDMQTKAELDAVRTELMDTINKIEGDRDRLSKEYEEEKKKANQRVAALEASLEEEKSAREARAQEIAELRRTMNNNANATATERANLQKRIAELERRKSRGGGCVLQ